MTVQTTHLKGYETEYVSTRMQGMDDVSARYYIQSPATMLKTGRSVCVCVCVCVYKCM